MKRVGWLKPEQLPEWDAFAENHPFGWISHLSAWKEVLERSFKHIRGHFLALWDDDSNQILAGLPIYTVKSWLTGNRLVSVPFLTHCEALISFPQDMDKLLPPILDLYKHINASYIKLVTWRSAPLIQEPRMGTYRVYKHHYITFDSSLDDLRKKFHKTSVRQPISRALKGPLKVKIGESMTDLSAFFYFYSLTRKRLGLPLIPYRFFSSLWETLGSSPYLTLFLALYEGQPVSANLVLKYKDIALAEFAGDRVEYRKLYANQLLDWEAIKLSYNEGYAFYSFGRTALNNKGLMAYKSRWGTTVDDFHIFSYPGSFAERSVERESSWKYRLIAKMSQKAPGALFQILGKIVYRHMG